MSASRVSLGQSPAGINAAPAEIPADILAAPVVEKSPEPPLPSITVTERSHRTPTFLDLDQSTTDPSRHYRWVRCRKDEHMISIISTKLEGYRIEYWPDSPQGKAQGWTDHQNVQRFVRPVTETERRPDGVISVGDLILMSTSKFNHEERQREQFARTEGLLAATSAQTEQMAKEKGVRVIKDADHNT